MTTDPWAAAPLAIPEADQCLDRDADCGGPVNYHAVPGGNAFLRCEKHWQERLDRWENSIEREALSPLAPSWFDPSYAGERWEEDD